MDWMDRNHFDVHVCTNSPCRCSQALHALSQSVYPRMQARITPRSPRQLLLAIILSAAAWPGTLPPAPRAVTHARMHASCRGEELPAPDPLAPSYSYSAATHTHARTASATGVPSPCASVPASTSSASPSPSPVPSLRVAGALCSCAACLPASPPAPSVPVARALEERSSSSTCACDRRPLCPAGAPRRSFPPFGRSSSEPAASLASDLAGSSRSASTTTLAVLRLPWPARPSASPRP